jgi:SAM-dependent methyltransferase
MRAAVDPTALSPPRQNDGGQALEDYRKAEWLAFEASPYFAPERMAILEAKPLALIFEDREPWYRLICETVRDLSACEHAQAGLPAASAAQAGLAPQGTLLDVGCGLGQQYEACARWCPQVRYTGADAIERCLEVCRRRQPEADWRAVTYPGLPEIEDGSFDLALLRSILRYYCPENGLRMIHAAWRAARKALVLGLWFPPAGGDHEEATPDGRGSYHVRWPEGALKSIHGLPGVRSVTVVPAPDPDWPDRRLMVLTR